MDGKKLFILYIDNNPKVWYNKGGDCAAPAFRDFSGKKFLCILPIDKIAGMWYNGNVGPLGRWRAGQPNLLLYHIQEGFVNSEIKQKKSCPNLGQLYYHLILNHLMPAEGAVPRSTITL